MKNITHTMNRIYPFFLFFLVLSMIIGVSSCGNSSPKSDQATLNLVDEGPITLDPAGTAESRSASYIVQIFSGLVRLNENMQVVPDIAEAWEKSTDGITFVFHLYKNVRFHDGKEVKASDFKYSWERALSPSTNSPTAGMYLNDIVGAADILSGKNTQLIGVSVLDDYTLQVTIDAPKAYFLEKMAYPTAFVLDRYNVQSGSNWWLHPNGTGPFKLKQWQQDQTVILERNESYYGEKAKLKQVVFKLNAGGSIQLYQEGSIDVAFVSSAYIGLVTDPTNPVSKELQSSPELSLSYIGFNVIAPPFDDPKVRQAFSYAIDKDKLIKLSTDNVVAAAYGILPPGINGYNPNVKGLHFDPERAMQLISESKYGSVANLPPVVLTTSGFGGLISGLTGGVIEEIRRNLGLEVTVRQLETEQFLYNLKEEKDQMYEIGWIADYPDPQDFLEMLLRSNTQNNNGEYSNPQLDDILDRAAVEQDAATRMKMYQEAEQIAVDDAAILPLFFGRNYILVKPYVKDYVFSPLGFPLLNKVSIQK